MKCGCKSCGKNYVSPSNPYKKTGNFFNAKIPELPTGLVKGKKK